MCRTHFAPAHRLAALLAGILLGLGAVGCGGRPATESIRATLTRFGQAVERHDYAALCRDVFTAELVQGLLERNLSCERALEIGLANVRGAQLQVLRITVNGDRAQALVRSIASGEAPASDTVALVREAAGWRVASVAGGSPGPTR